MATTENFLNGDGTAIEFSFSFPYIKTEDVRVELQEIDSTQPINDQIISSTAVTLFTIPSNNPTVIQFDSLSAATNYQAITGAPLANHAINTGNTIRIRIYRSTSSNQTPATFFSGGAIRSQDLNDNFDSILYINQEKENELNQVIAGGIADGSITTAKLADNAVTTAKIVNNAVTTDKIINDAVTTAKIVNNAVTTDKIINDAVTTDKIVNDAVTTPKIVNDAVTTPKIIDDAVTTPKILDANVTPAKLSTGGPGWTSSGALGLNGANYGTEYQIAQSNGSGSASTWVNRSEKDTEIDIVSSPAAAFKNIAFDTAALEWANKIDIYFRDVSCNDNSGSLTIRLLDQTNNTFSAGTLIGFGFVPQYYNTPNFIDFLPRVWAQDNGINIPWGVTTSTRTGRLTLFNAQSTVWMVDFQAVTSTNPVFPQQFQGSYTGNGYQVQPASGTGQLGGVQFNFDSGNIDSGYLSVHYS